LSPLVGDVIEIIGGVVSAADAGLANIASMTGISQMDIDRERRRFLFSLRLSPDLLPELDVLVEITILLIGCNLLCFATVSLHSQSFSLVEVSSSSLLIL
jgi:hypothetical protein